MPYFRVTLESDPSGNFKGFFTTRFVHASDTDEAVGKAKALTRAELGRDQPMRPDSIEEVGTFEYFFGKPRRGFTFYDHEP